METTCFNCNHTFNYSDLDTKKKLKNKGAKLRRARWTEDHIYIDNPLFNDDDREEQKKLGVAKFSTTRTAILGTVSSWSYKGEMLHKYLVEVVNCVECPLCNNNIIINKCGEEGMLFTGITWELDDYLDDYGVDIDGLELCKDFDMDIIKCIFCNKRSNHGCSSSLKFDLTEYRIKYQNRSLLQKIFGI